MEPSEESADKKKLQKEYLFIVTDYQPFTISDLRVMPSNYINDSSFEYSMNSPKNYCLESIK